MAKRRLRGDAESGDGACQRYRVRMFKSAAGEWSLVAIDTCSDREVLSWVGFRLGRLLEAHPTLWAATERRALYCSKAYIRRLAMDKAALDMAMEPEQRPATDRLTVATSPDRDERVLLRLLKSHCGQHYTADDVLCLLTLNGYRLTEARASRLLAALAAKGELQEIRLSDGRVFFDCDTRPHLHIFDPVRNELFDAPESGVIEGAALV